MIDLADLRDVLGALALPVAALVGVLALARGSRRRPPALVRQAGRLARQEVRWQQWAAWGHVFRSLVRRTRRPSKPDEFETRRQNRSW